MIDTARLDVMFRDAMFTDDEMDTDLRADITAAHEAKEDLVTDDFIFATGIVHSVPFHPARLASHRAEVEAMLDQIGPEFHKSGGGGWSFLNFCMDRDGNQWGEHGNMEQLCLLAIGLDLAEWQLPRELWSSLPGNMPYFVIY